MNRLFLPILLLFLVIACSAENEDPAVPKPTDVDSEAPAISISTFPDIIERISSFQLSITDESSVSTQIYVDNILVIETTTKTITFDIDPFDFPIGNRTLRITSTDTHSNESSLSIPFELKKLLFVLPNPFTDNAFPGQDQFLSVNLEDGSLYMSKQITNDDDGTFYANDDFQRQQFIVSLYRSTNTTSVNYHNIYSFSNIEPGTVLLPYSERINFFNTGNLPQGNPLLLELSELTNPKVYGYNGSLVPSGGGSYLLNYNLDAPKKYFLYDFPDLGNTQTDYTYTIISYLEKTSYTAVDLSTTNEFTSISLPDQSLFSLYIEGYETEEDYNQNRFYRILHLNEVNLASNTVDIPLFPDIFETYNMIYSTVIDGKLTFSSKQKAVTSPVISNDIQISKEGQRISINGSHDYSRISFRYGFSAPNTFSNTFDWAFYSRESTSIQMPLENFEIPQVLSVYFEERGILPRPSQQTNDSYILDLEVYDHSDAVIYENMMFGSSYNQNEAGDVIWLTYSLKN